MIATVMDLVIVIVTIVAIVTIIAVIAIIITIDLATHKWSHMNLMSQQTIRMDYKAVEFLYRGFFPCIMVISIQ